MAQDAQINWAQLDYLILGQFLKKKCLVFEDWSFENVWLILIHMPFLHCKIFTFSNQFTKILITFDGIVLLA